MESTDPNSLRERTRERVVKATKRMEDLTSRCEALESRDKAQADAVAQLKSDLQSRTLEHKAAVAQLTQSLASAEAANARNRDERSKLEAALNKADLATEQLTKDLKAAQGKLAQLESALRQRQEETEQAHRARIESGKREAALRSDIAAGLAREAALEARLHQTNDQLRFLSAQNHSAAANARSAWEHVKRLHIGRAKADERARVQLTEMAAQIVAANKEAQRCDEATTAAHQALSQLQIDLVGAHGHAAYLEGVIAKLKNDAAKEQAGKLALARRAVDLELAIATRQRHDAVEAENLARRQTHDARTGWSWSAWWRRLTGQVNG